MAGPCSALGSISSLLFPTDKADDARWCCQPILIKLSKGENMSITLLRYIMVAVAVVLLGKTGLPRSWRDGDTIKNVCINLVANTLFFSSLALKALVI